MLNFVWHCQSNLGLRKLTKEARKEVFRATKAKKLAEPEVELADAEAEWVAYLELIEAQREDRAAKNLE